ncbi:MAG TPA: folylpolyglutamate synthase/dihydrofolate synthase family protein [Vicinamibacterales bacterium]|nr:folylpolyglutamate synthase/dihydrofolate synthase family protein [Vicinamibacterales bacterium]
MDPLTYLFGLEHFGIKFGLDNMRAIVAALGHPERTFRSVHIGGTNGKGSVTAMVDAGLRAAGHRVARYTSPHLVALNERFVVDGRAVDDDTMVAAIASVRDVVEALRRDGALEVHPTFFEVTTAVAFEIFRRASVELAVVEVGLGGRLDATNVIIPEACAITSIDFDHEQYLGSSLGVIAWEKAGILKPGVPVVLGGLDPEAAARIEEVANEIGAPIVRTSASDLGERAVGLSGQHQRGNAAVALGLLEVLNRRGITVPPAAVDAALLETHWPGRLDLRRLPDGRELLMDAAHNPAGAAALAQYLRAQPGPSLPLVFAAMRDKNIVGMFRALLPAVASLTLTRATSPRSAEPDGLAQAAREIAPSLEIAVERSLPAALDGAWRAALTARHAAPPVSSHPVSSPPARIVVAGSIFLLGDVMQQLGLHW